MTRNPYEPIFVNSDHLPRIWIVNKRRIQLRIFGLRVVLIFKLLLVYQSLRNAILQSNLGFFSLNSLLFGLDLRQFHVLKDLGLDGILLFNFKLFRVIPQAVTSLRAFIVALLSLIIFGVIVRQSLFGHGDSTTFLGAENYRGFFLQGIALKSLRVLV